MICYYLNVHFKGQRFKVAFHYSLMNEEFHSCHITFLPSYLMYCRLKSYQTAVASGVAVKFHLNVKDAVYLRVFRYFATTCKAKPVWRELFSFHLSQLDRGFLKLTNLAIS